MPGTELIVLVIVVGLVLLNLYTTMRVVRDKLSDRVQKIAQTALVWVVPLVGAIIVLYLHREEKFERREYQIGPHDLGGPGGDHA